MQAIFLLPCRHTSLTQTLLDLTARLLQTLTLVGLRVTPQYLYGLLASVAASAAAAVPQLVFRSVLLTGLSDDAATGAG